MVISLLLIAGLVVFFVRRGQTEKEDGGLKDLLTPFISDSGNCVEMSEMSTSDHPLVRSNPGSTGAFAVGAIPEQLLTEDQRHDQQQHQQQQNNIPPAHGELKTEIFEPQVMDGWNCAQCGRVLTHMNVLADSSDGGTAEKRLCSHCSCGESCHYMYI